MKGLDYSLSHPDPLCVAAQGYAFVARYVGVLEPNSAKYLDAAELTQIRAAGLSIICVRETVAGFMLTGDGAAHAVASRGHLRQLGISDDTPIFYALDVDPRNLTTAERANVIRFLRAAAAADGGRSRVGIYGSDDAMDWWARSEHCQWGWQTFAWSSGRISPNAHFRQYRNGVAVCGGTVDLNETYADDFGQWPRPSTSSPPPSKEDAMPYPVIAVPGDPEGRDVYKALYVGGYESLDAEEYDAGVASGMFSLVRSVTARQHDVACDLALRLTVPPTPGPVGPQGPAGTSPAGSYEGTFTGTVSLTAPVPSLTVDIPTDE